VTLPRKQGQVSYIVPGRNTGRTLLCSDDCDIWPRRETDFATVVKPSVLGQKNEMQDAAAICEAASRPEMRFAPQKSITQQNLQMWHRVPSRPVANRTKWEIRSETEPDPPLTSVCTGVIRHALSGAVCAGRTHRGNGEAHSAALSRNEASQRIAQLKESVR
jgi:transposase